jgi:NitT/TauT family transport system ATP-binding protein
MVAPVQPVQGVEAEAEQSVPMLTLEGVSKTFTSGKQAVEAVRDVSLEIVPGEFVVFVGPSGCGKSTLLNMIAGFDRPSEGRILVQGQPVTRPCPDRLMMFQEHALFPWLNVMQNVTYGLRWKYRFKPRFRRERGRELLRMVHLDEFERSRVHELSGGMKQRAALARALAPDPKILLIDEPFPALDALTRQKLYGDVQEIFTATRKTIVSVTHDTREAACLGDRVIVFSARPARYKSEVRIDLPRPRDVNDPKVAEYAQQIMRELEGELENSDNRNE